MQTGRPGRRPGTGRAPPAGHGPGAAWLLAAALALAGCTDPTASDLVGKARASLAAQDAEAARVQLKSALELAPDLTDARWLLGRLLHQRGNMPGAEFELRRALDGGHPPDQVLPLLAEAMLANGKALQLQEQFGGAVLGDAEARLRFTVALAQAAAATGAREEAQRLVAVLLAAQPDLGVALRLRARLTAEAGDRGTALKQVQALLERQPQDAEAWLLQGDLLAPPRPPNAEPGPRPGAADAIAAYRQALQRQPQLLAAHGALVRLLLEQGDLTSAVIQWNTLLKLAPRHRQTLVLEVGICVARGDHQRALNVAQRLLRDTPDDAEVRRLAGVAALQLGALAQAEGHLARASQLLPQSPAVRRLLAQAQLRAGHPDRVLATLAPLTQGIEPDIDALLMQVQAMRLAGDQAGADSTLLRATWRRPDDARLRTAQALAALARGDITPQDLDKLRAAAAADPGVDIDRGLIDALVRRGDLAAATQAVDALARKRPDDPEPDMLRAGIAQARKDGPAARRHYEAALRHRPDHLLAIDALAALDLAEGQPAAARARYEALLQRNPRHVPAMLALASVLGRSGADAAEVDALLQAAVAAEPADAAARLRLADQLLATHRPKDALEATQRGLAALPDHPQLLDRLGRAQLLLGNVQQAVAAFTKVTTAEPRSATAMLRLAEAQWAARSGAAAAAAVRRAAVLAPGLPEVQLAQAQLALRENQPDEALALARRLQAQQPESGAGWSIEAEVAMRRGQWPAAVAALRQVVQRVAPGDAPVRLHRALLAARQPEEAEAFAQRWRRQQPDDLAFMVHLGGERLAQGQPERAAALYRQVLQRQPGHLEALMALARLKARQKQPGAVDLAEEALGQAPHSVAALDTLAFALASEQQLARAVEVQRQAVHAWPDVQELRLQLARLMIANNDKSGARLELQALAQLGPRFERQAEVSALLRDTE